MVEWILPGTPSRGRGLSRPDPAGPQCAFVPKRPALGLLLPLLLTALSLRADVVLTVSKGGVGHETDVELSWSPAAPQEVWVYALGRSFDRMTGATTPAHYHAGALEDGVDYAYALYDSGAMPRPGDLLATDAIVGGMRCVPAATPWGFRQGSPPEEPCRVMDEAPFIHTLTRDLVVMETEATRKMWAELRAVQLTLPEDPTVPSLGPDHPVVDVTWYEAVLFANLLSLQNGYGPCYYRDTNFSVPVDATNYLSDEVYCDFEATGYRLLSEGEWEHAARAGTAGPYSCDEGNYAPGTCLMCDPGTLPTLEKHAVFCASSGGSCQPAGSKLANPWGLHDMHGNAREWCWDWADTYPEGGTDYAGPGSGTDRICRGSMFVYMPRNVRSAMRDGFPPDRRGQYISFRLARTVAPALRCEAPPAS